MWKTKNLALVSPYKKEWHRNWKNQFDVSFQEIVFTDKKSGKKHIADICITNNLVIEFQHSPNHPEEQLAREIFYKNMV